MEAINMLQNQKRTCENNNKKKEEKDLKGRPI